MTPVNDKIEAYARALHEIAEANHCIEAIKGDLGHLAEFIRKTPAVREFLASDTVTAPGKHDALAELLGEQLHPVLVQFALLMVAAGDAEQIPPLATAFVSAAVGDAQTATGEIHSAVTLSPERLAEIEAEVGLTLKCKVSLQPKVMNNILGGIRVKVGDTIIDGTLDTQLENARRNLLA